MAKARYRIEQAEVVDLSAATKAILVDGTVLLQRGKDSLVLNRREVEVLAAVVGVGDGIPVAIRNGMVAAGQLPAEDSLRDTEPLEPAAS